MPPTTINSDKELAQGYQPLLLATFTFLDGSTLRVATHEVTYSSNLYLGRITNHGVQAIQALSSQGIDVVPSVTLRLADADSFILVNYELAKGFKGATVDLTLVLLEVGTSNFSSDSVQKFFGRCDPATIESDSEISVTATNELSVQKRKIPSVRIQKRCPWIFPRTATERQAAADSPESRFFRCGYSPDATGGNARGNNNGGSPFTDCDYTTKACEDRGMYDEDSSARSTKRYGGITYEPLDRRSRGYKSSFEQIENSANVAKYNDFFPVVYGAQWLEPPIMNVNADANLTKFETVVSLGEILVIRRVVVNDVEIFRANQGSSNLAGWYSIINLGSRTGAFNQDDFYKGLGDPYGSLVAVMVTVPRQLSDSGSLPNVRIQVSGKKVRQFTTPGSWTDDFSFNTVWIIADILKDAGIPYDRLDLQSWIDAAAICNVSVSYTDLNDQAGSHSRYKASLAIRQQRSVADVVRGLRNSCKGLLVPNSSSGKIEFRIKQTLADQQGSPIAGSNYNTEVASQDADGNSANGYVAYLFDESSVVEGSLRATQRSISDSPTTYSFAFQDEDNGFEQDSLKIIDTDATAIADQEIPSEFSVDGIMNYDQGKRVIATLVAESMKGNPRADAGGTWEFDWETTIRAAHLRVGDIVLLQWAKYGPLDDNLESPPATPIAGALVRITSLRPASNFETIRVKGHWHRDVWYTDLWGQVPDPGHKRQFRDQLSRPPYPWQPFDSQPAVGDPMYSDDEYFFGLKIQNTILADGAVQTDLCAQGQLPINDFSANTRPPFVPLQGTTASTGGSLAGDKTYWVAICSKDTAGADFKLSAPSRLVQIEVPAGTSTNTITVPDIFWPSDAAGHYVFAGLDPSKLTFQSTADTTPASITLADLNDLHWCVPDGEFLKMRLKAKIVIHSGALGTNISDATTSTIEVLNAFWTTNQWAGHYCSIIGFKEDFGFLPIANFEILSNTSDTLTLTGGSPDPVALGVAAEDLLVIRSKPGSVDANSYTDPNWNHSLATFPLTSISDASNATPIVITQTAHGLSTSDQVRVDSVEGNTAANGVWTITVLTGDTYELDGSVGNGAYIVGTGRAAKLTGGLLPDDEVGRLVRIIAGTGRGQTKRIAANTGTKITIEGAWEIQPDATSVIIIEEPQWRYQADGTPVNNATVGKTAELCVSTDNWVNKPLLLGPFGVDGGGAESFEHIGQFREVFVYGAEGETGASALIEAEFLN